MSRVALLIPVYNNQDGLERSLAALTDEVPLDIVVVDDGSTPPIRLPEVPPPYRAFLLRLEQNRGIEHALNHGLGWILERGYAYVARLDAGDIPLPGRILKQVEFLEENPEHALVGGQVQFVGLDGKEVFQERFPTEDAQIRRIMHARNCFIHPAVMLRTSALKAVGLYSDRYKALEDFELFFRIMQRFKVANLSDYVVRCEVNPGGISLTKRREQVLGRLRVMLLHFDPRIKESWLGLLKNLLLLFTPVPVVQALKQRLEGRRGWL